MEDAGKLDKMLRQNEKHLKRMREVLGHETVATDPRREPEWKKRRRS